MFLRRARGYLQQERPCVLGLPRSLTDFWRELRMRSGGQSRLSAFQSLEYTLCAVLTRECRY